MPDSNFGLTEHVRLVLPSFGNIQLPAQKSSITHLIRALHKVEELSLCERTEESDCYIAVLRDRR